MANLITGTTASETLDGTIGDDEIHGGGGDNVMMTDAHGKNNAYGGGNWTTRILALGENCSLSWFSWLHFFTRRSLRQTPAVHFTHARKYFATNSPFGDCALPAIKTC